MLVNSSLCYSLCPLSFFCSALAPQGITGTNKDADGNVPNWYKQVHARGPSAVDLTFVALQI